MAKGPTVQRGFGLRGEARRVGYIASFTALLLGCSGKSDGGAQDSSAGHNESGHGGANNGANVSGGGTIGSFAGDEGTGNSAGRTNGGTSNAAGGAGGAVISGAGRTGILGRAGSSGTGNADSGLLGVPCRTNTQC